MVTSATVTWLGDVALGTLARQDSGATARRAAMSVGQQGGLDPGEVEYRGMVDSLARCGACSGTSFDVLAIAGSRVISFEAVVSKAGRRGSVRAPQQRCMRILLTHAHTSHMAAPYRENACSGSALSVPDSSLSSLEDAALPTSWLINSGKKTSCRLGDDVVERIAAATRHRQVFTAPSLA